MNKLMITIPEPCHENWENMSGTDKGRFCNACAKEVVDFSQLSDAEMLNYFSTLTTANVCGRVYPDQLNRTIAIPEPIKRKRFWYWNYVAMFFLFFSKSVTIKAQGKVKANNTIKQDQTKIKNSVMVRSTAAPKLGRETIVRLGGVSGFSISAGALYIVDGEIIANANDINTDDVLDVAVLQGPAAVAIYGTKGQNGAIVITTKKGIEKEITAKILDKENRPVAFASIQSKGHQGLNADGEGNFKIKCKVGDELKISAVGFKEHTLLINNQVQDTIVLEKSAVETLPEIVVAANGKMRVVGKLVSYTYKTTTVKNVIADTLRILKNDLLNNISIYPNPVARGIAFNISSKINIPGNSIVQIVNAAGAMMRKQILTITKHQSIIIPQQWSSGIYYLTLMDEKGRIVARKSFMVN